MCIYAWRGGKKGIVARRANVGTMKERGTGWRGWRQAIARARYKLHLNRSRGTRGIRNLNGHGGGRGIERGVGKDLVMVVDREEKQESGTSVERREIGMKWNILAL